MNYEIEIPADRAVALTYSGSGAPRVTAKGTGATADNIIALARRHDIPVCEDPALLALLASVDLGDEIPPALYVAVAEVIAFAYMLTGKKPDGHPDSALRVRPASPAGSADA